MYIFTMIVLTAMRSTREKHVSMYEYAAVCLYFTSTILRGAGRAEGATL